MGGGVSWVNSGQSYKESTSVNYDSRVILTIILLKCVKEFIPFDERHEQ